MSVQFQAIREAFSAMRRDSKMRHRDIAEKLGISEGTMIAAHEGLRKDSADDEAILQARRLRPEWPELMASLAPLGEVMALTRNPHCVHEKIGIYQQVSQTGTMGVVSGSAIELRIFYNHWAHGFAVTERTPQGEQCSLQFFDAAGVALHKVFLKPQSSISAYENLCSRFAAASQQADSIDAPIAPRAAESPDSDIDIVGLQQAWGGLRDTHDFLALLHRFGVSRLQAMRLASPEYVQPVTNDSVRQVLHAAAAQGLAIMVFVGNPGLVQIHSGAVHKVAVMGPWLNVLDPTFNLHLREDYIDSVWIVKKPSGDGLVSSLEVFDKNGETIALFFGACKSDQPELQAWSNLLADLQTEGAACQI